MADLEPQPIPDVPVYCPECGGEPVKQSGELKVEHRLGAMGYLHDDQNFECSECGNTWAHGVPVGEIEWDDADDLRCHSCRHDPDLDEEQYYRVHRVVPSRESSPGGPGEVTLHLKCPRCHLFSKVQRQMGKKGIALVGFPDITGSVDHEDVEAYGYDEGRWEANGD